MAHSQDLPEDDHWDDAPRRTVKTLPSSITSYDLLKALALVLMLVDHTGYYFFPVDAAHPEHAWFRVLGRLCVPIWFFLIGFARTTEIPVRLWVCATLALASKMAVGEFVLPLNILFTIIAARYVRDACAQKTLETPEHMRGMVLLILLGTLPTALFFEYGALVLMFVIYGYLRRNPGDVKVKPLYVRLFVGLSFLFYFILQGATMGVITVDQSFTLALGLGLVFLMLQRFAPAEYPRLTAALGPLSGVVRLAGRRTLEIYVLHLILFRAAALYFYPETFVFWNWSVMDPGLLSMIIRQG